MTDVFTCVTCNIAFKDAEFQREHYKADWHRYNLKRKVAELPPIDLKDFTHRVQVQKAEVILPTTKKKLKLFLHHKKYFFMGRPAIKPYFFERIFIN